jgi:hypothetical protein
MAIATIEAKAKYVVLMTKLHGLRNRIADTGQVRGVHHTCS